MAISSAAQTPRAGMRNRIGRLSESVLNILSRGNPSEDKMHTPAHASTMLISKLIVTLLVLATVLISLSSILQVIRPLTQDVSLGLQRPQSSIKSLLARTEPLSVRDYPSVLVSQSESFNSRQTSGERDDTQSSLVSSASENEVTREKGVDISDEPVARLIVMTMDRAASLQRLLASLSAANYGEDTVDLDIWIDRRNEGEVNEEVLHASRKVMWKHGTKTIHKRTVNAGLYQQWIYTWNITAETTEVAVILEDDLEVSPAFYQWLRVARAAYAQDPEVAAFTLQRSTLRPRQRRGFTGPLKIPKEHPVFKYRLLGTWGFAPQRDQWVEFRKWFEEKRAHGEKPYVNGLMTTNWYKSQEVDGFAPNMWSQWWIKFVDEKNYFTVTAHLPDGTTLAANWRESGLHYSKKRPEMDFPIFRGNDEQFVMPDNPIHVDWDGKIIQYNANTNSSAS